MINWGVVAAFISPLIAALALLGGWFAWLGRQRDKRVADQIASVTDRLEVRITQVEATLTQQTAHLERQDAALTTTMQAVARIEGRLFQVIPAVIAPPT